MAENRLPIVDGDDGVWGEIINQFLSKEHYNTGTDNAANGGHKTITIRPGTATAGTAPLKFSSGTVLSSPEAGAMEFNSDSLYFTVTTGAVRKTIAMYDDASGATGDLYRRDSSGNLVRIPIGSNGDFLKVASGLPAWGAASLTKTDVGLGNVDNTSDANKPVSTATQAALTTQSYNLTRQKYFPYLRGWNAGIADRSTTPARVVLFGDSLTMLQGSKIANRLNAQFNGNADSHFKPPGYTGWGTWTTWTGSVAASGSGAFHGLGTRGGTLSGSEEGTLTATCDGFVVSYDVQQSGGADLNIYIDNVLQTTINTTDGAISGSIESGRLWTSSALTYGSHTLKVTRSGSGTAMVGGALYTNNNRASGVQVWNAGHSGADCAYFLTTDQATFQATKNMAPSLIIVHLGTNDYSAGTSTFQTNLTSVVQRLKTDTPLASIVLVAPYKVASRTDWPDFVQVVKDVAAAESTGYIDAYESMGGLGNADDSYNLDAGDQVHMNNKGGHLLASTIVSAITIPDVDNEVPYVRADGTTVATGTLQANGGVIMNLGVAGSMGFANLYGPIFTAYRVAGDTNVEFGMFNYNLGVALGYPGFVSVYGLGGASAYDTAFYRSAAGEMTVGAGSASTFGNIKTNLLRNNAGTPESVISAPVGAIAQDTTNGIVYVKKSGTGNTGWQRVLGAGLEVSTKTATTYTVTSSDTVIIADATSNSITITLPLASSLPGYRYYIKRKDSTGNTVTIARTSSDTIDGATSQTLNQQYTSATIVSDGSNWYIL